MANSGALTTFDDTTRREDLLDFIHNISPKDRPFLTGAGRSTAKNTYHEWMTDTLDTRGDNAQPEDDNDAPTYSALTQPSRVGNITQIIQKNFKVTSTQQAVDHAGQTNPFAYQKAKALEALLNDTEHALIRGSIASGTGSSARRMRGMLNAITTNATAVASGTAWSETLLSGLRQLTYTSGIQQGEETDLYLTAWLKRRTSLFATGVNTIEVEAVGRRVVRDIMRYESDFGPINIMICRDMLTGTNAESAMLTLPEPIKVAYLHAPISKKPAQPGRNEPGIIFLEATLEYGNEAAHAKITALSNTL